MSWTNELFSAFDTETTSPEPNGCRLVTATLVTIEPGQDPAVKTWMADPGCDIPAEATEIHGITTEHAREHGRPMREVVDEIRLSLAGAFADGPVVIYNASFDLTVITRECERVGHKVPFVVTGTVIDPLVIDKALDRYRPGSRKLTAACEHYGVRLDGAHDATEDALAAARVAWKIARKWEWIGRVSLASLHEKQRGWFEQQQVGFADYLAVKVAGTLLDEAAQADEAGDTDTAAAKRAEADEVKQRAEKIRAEGDHWPVRGAAA